MAWAERWDGTTWTLQITPQEITPVSSALQGVCCPSTMACTAVGYANPDLNSVPLAEAWDGTSWAIQATSAHLGDSQLLNVSCSSVTACTAVGYVSSSLSGPGSTSDRPLAELWNGTTWKTQNTPNPAGNRLQDVSCISVAACTAVGWSVPPSTTTIGGRSSTE